MNQNQRLTVAIVALVVGGLAFGGGYMFGKSKTKTVVESSRAQAFGNPGAGSSTTGGQGTYRRGGAMGSNTTMQIMQLLRSASSDEQTKILTQLQQDVGTTTSSSSATQS